MNLIAYPWLTHPQTHEVVDVHGEWLGTGKLPSEYEEFLYGYYKTRDKRKILRHLLQDDPEVPVWDEDSEKVMMVPRSPLQVAAIHLSRSTSK